MSLTWLDPIDPEGVPAQVVRSGQAHPMRTVTHAAAAEVGAWTPELLRQVSDTFDHLAGEWHTHHGADRLAALTDAFTRGGPLPDHGRWLELGSGDGWATAEVARHAPRQENAGSPALVAVDLSMAMLRRAPSGPVPRLRADAARLPVDDHAFTVAVLMNMLLFPTELDRVLAPGGRVVWLSSRGIATPIHLSPEQVVSALPGRWGGVAAQHGTAIWTVLHRTG